MLIIVTRGYEQGEVALCTKNELIGITLSIGIGCITIEANLL